MTTAAHDASHPPAPGAGHGAEAHGHEHPKFLAHHFETPQQQFDSGKLGVWLFLTTEILLFSGLFCAYAVYRRIHPEIFAYAHLYLSKPLGALNTIVLIFSSFTMAWGVRAIQVGKKQLCMVLLGITIACGAGFMCIKGVEYSAKFKERLFPGGSYNPDVRPGQVEESKGEAQMPGTGTLAAAGGESKTAGSGEKAAAESKPAAAAAPTVPYTGPATTTAPGYLVEQSQIPRAQVGPEGVSAQWAEAHDTRAVKKAAKEAGEEAVGPEPYNTQIFFSIYFLMTGLHGLHVLAGMGLIGWVLLRTKRGDFGPDYFSPVDFVGLYWHIVDLVWIFLFPLLYLIGNTP